MIKYNVSDLLSLFCVNSSCDMFLIDCAFVKTKMFNIKIKKCFLISLRDIDATKYILNEWFFVNVYLKSENKVNNKIIVYIRYEVHLINNLKTKFLMSINILESKQMIINILN